MKTTTTTRGRYGFTLIEILVTIGILALLLGMLIPGVKLALDTVKENKTMASIQMISGGVKQYANDFDELPPSDPGEVEGLASGAQIICAFMTGYADDSDSGSAKGEPDPAESGANYGVNQWTQDDGKDGMGFRAKKRGHVYGPYNGCDNVPMAPGITIDASVPRVFLDAWDNPILYYLDTGNSTKFDNGDNSSGFSYSTNEKACNNPNNISMPSSSYLSNNKFNDASEEFLLLSAGSAKEFSTDEIDDAISNISESE